MSAAFEATVPWQRRCNEAQPPQASLADTPIRTCPTRRPQGELFNLRLLQKISAVELLQFTAEMLWVELPRGQSAFAEGVTYKVNLTCGSFGTAKMRAKVSSVIGGTHRTVLQLKMLRPSRRALQTLGQYALRHGDSGTSDLTPAMLRRRRFGAIDAGPCLHYGALTAPDEVAQLKRLRFEVYLQAKLLKPYQQHPDDTIDDRDANSHIILVHWHHTLVASARAYAMRVNDTWEFATFKNNLRELPEDILPPHTQCMELSRAAIAEPFRHSGIPMALLRRLTAHTMAAGRRYMVLGASPHLVPLYKYFGFEQTPVRCEHPGREAFVGTIMVADLHALWQGNKGNPLIWYALFGSLPQDCDKGFYAQHTRQDKFRVALLRKLGSVSLSVRYALSWHSRLRLMKASLKNFKLL